MVSRGAPLSQTPYQPPRPICLYSKETSSPALPIPISTSSRPVSSPKAHQAVSIGSSIPWPVSPHHYLLPLFTALPQSIIQFSVVCLAPDCPQIRDLVAAVFTVFLSETQYTEHTLDAQNVFWVNK